MNLKVRGIVENRKGRQIVRIIDQRGIVKEEITSTEFPEGGDTIYTKRTPGISTGGYFLYRELLEKLISRFGPTHRDKSTKSSF